MAETVAESKKKGSFFGKEEMKLLKDPLHSDNPITIQVLGICSALGSNRFCFQIIGYGSGTYFCMCIF